MRTPTAFLRSSVLALLLGACAVTSANALALSCPVHDAAFATKLPSGVEATATPHRLIVIGFMGGRVDAANAVHRELMVAQQLQKRYPQAVHAAVFANHDEKSALRAVLTQLDDDKDGCLSATEKTGARVVIYGHSWGASETVALARKLNDLGIPVLLTVQVDSVQKPNHQDGLIPPNVGEAINFYQTEGLLHGRTTIVAMNPKRTKILGNFQSSYKGQPVDCAGYPWFARTFMKAHIEIENDPTVWDKIEALIGTKVVEPA
ncbi:hypothetical protein SAMN05421770_10593 [Granulicella rosea]|uniref:EF-hand domain-containing protein n=1 Tax=Granulicella rosea TaxID=474952 RepID=A0A239KNS0_9BACT|nr:hypothetical protein [Granulicella rosea]SNT19715.1 hypothetical protein SAMN05421770_10593 [Granulicella rosea]